MNKWQRIVLIIGAIIFYFTLMTIPRVVHRSQGMITKPTTRNQKYARVMDVRTATVRGVAVLGATVLIFFALKKKD